VRPIFAAAVLRNFFGAFYAALYVIYALHVLGLSILMLGLAVGCGGVGGLAGAVLAPAVTRRLGIGRTIVITGLAAGALSFLTPLASGAPIVALMFLMTSQLFGDGIETVTEISASSLRQSVLPGDLLGRAAGAFMASQGLAGVLGAIVGGLLGRALGVRETLYFAAAGIAAAPLVGLFSPLWRVRRIGDDDRA
jgi:MFS-type transporter involved in bile tolerance (Atg22 family)